MMSGQGANLHNQYYLSGTVPCAHESAKTRSKQAANVTSVLFSRRPDAPNRIPINHVLVLALSSLLCALMLSVELVQ